MELGKGLTPALLSFDGIQYQYMAPGVLEEKQLAFLQEHLRILSGFYGVLRPFDGVAALPPGDAGKAVRFRIQGPLRLLGLPPG